jgi:hypothetical protein
VLELSITETAGDSRGAGEKTRQDTVNETTAYEPVRRGTQNLASIPSAEPSPSGRNADQDILGRESGCSQVQFTGRLNPTAGTKSRLKAN